MRIRKTKEDKIQEAVQNFMRRLHQMEPAEAVLSSIERLRLKLIELSTPFESIIINGISSPLTEVMFRYPSETPEHLLEKSQILEAFLKAGTNVNWQAENGAMPLMFAARYDSVSTMKLFRQYGANNDMDYYGNTVLMFAILGKKLENIKYAIEISEPELIKEALEGKSEELDKLIDYAKGREEFDIEKYLTEVKMVLLERVALDQCLTAEGGGEPGEDHINSADPAPRSSPANQVKKQKPVAEGVNPSKKTVRL